MKQPKPVKSKPARNHVYANTGTMYGVEQINWMQGWCKVELCEEGLLIDASSGPILNAKHGEEFARQILFMVERLLNTARPTPILPKPKKRSGK